MVGHFKDDSPPDASEKANTAVVSERDSNPPIRQPTTSDDPTSKRTKLLNELVTLCVNDSNAVLVRRIYDEKDDLVRNIINAAVNNPARDVYSFLIDALAKK